MGPQMLYVLAFSRQAPRFFSVVLFFTQHPAGEARSPILPLVF